MHAWWRTTTKSLQQRSNKANAGNNNDTTTTGKQQQKTRHFILSLATLDLYKLLSVLCENFTCICINPIDRSLVESMNEKRIGRLCVWEPSISIQSSVHIVFVQSNLKINSQIEPTRMDSQNGVLPVILNCRFSRIRGLIRNTRALALAAGLLLLAIAVVHVDFMQLLFVVVDFPLQLVSQTMGHGATVVRSTIGNGGGNQREKNDQRKSHETPSQVDRNCLGSVCWAAMFSVILPNGNATYHVVWSRLPNHHYC